MCHFFNLELLSHSSRKLCLRLMSFIAEYQDLPVIEGSGKAPNVSRSSSMKSPRNCLAMPTKSLFFDGAQLKVLKNCDGRSIGRWPLNVKWFPWIYFKLLEAHDNYERDQKDVQPYQFSNWAFPFVFHVINFYAYDNVAVINDCISFTCEYYWVPGSGNDMVWTMHIFTIHIHN